MWTLRSGAGPTSTAAAATATQTDTHTTAMRVMGTRKKAWSRVMRRETRGLAQKETIGENGSSVDGPSATPVRKLKSDNVEQATHVAGGHATSLQTVAVEMQAAVDEANTTTTVSESQAHAYEYPYEHRTRKPVFFFKKKYKARNAKGDNDAAYVCGEGSLTGRVFLSVESSSATTRVRPFVFW